MTLQEKVKLPLVALIEWEIQTKVLRELIMGNGQTGKFIAVRYGLVIEMVEVLFVQDGATQWFKIELKTGYIEMDSSIYHLGIKTFTQMIASLLMARICIMVITIRIHYGRQN
jgi:hypothetical protein